MIELEAINKIENMLNWFNPKWDSLSSKMINCKSRIKIIKSILTTNDYSLVSKDILMFLSDLKELDFSARTKSGIGLVIKTFETEYMRRIVDNEEIKILSEETISCIDNLLPKITHPEITDFFKNIKKILSKEKYYNLTYYMVNYMSQDVDSRDISEEDYLLGQIMHRVQKILKIQSETRYV